MNRTVKNQNAIGKNLGDEFSVLMAAVEEDTQDLVQELFCTRNKS